MTFALGGSSSIAALPLSGLSFTGRHTDGRADLWCHEVQGDWAALCAAGREFGREACHHIQTTGDAALLSAIVRTIAERGSFGGVEVGFFATLSEELAS